MALAKVGTVALGCSLLPHGLGSRRDFAWKKRGERTLAGGPGDGATWLWINWRLQHDTADGARIEGLPEPQASTSFPEIWYPGLGKGEKEGLCASVGILKDFSILTKTLSHYSKSI